MFLKNRLRHAKKVAENGRLVTLLSPDSLNSEQYRVIRTNIQYGNHAGKKLQTIVITSAEMGEGKSTSAANLAIVFADSKEKVLLIDADLRKPTVFKSFGMENIQGLSLALTSKQDVKTMIQATPINGLFVLPSGPKPPNPSELLSSLKMSELLIELKESYDYIIIDMPPLLPVTDTQIIAAQTDATILVVRESQTDKQSLIKSVRQLKHVNVNLIGVIYNGATQLKDQGYYY